MRNPRDEGKAALPRVAADGRGTVSGLRLPPPSRPSPGGAREAHSALHPNAANRRNTVRMLKISVLALASALSLAACDRDGLTDPDDLRDGQFEGVISGSLNGRLDGEALSGSTVLNLHDAIVLTDYEQGLEIAFYHASGEFTEGRYAIGDPFVGNDDVTAYVRVLDTGEYFDSLDGFIDLDDVRGAGITGRASFRGESDDVPGDIVDVDVTFVTDYAGDIDFNLSPAFSAGAKSSAKP